MVFLTGATIVKYVDCGKYELGQYFELSSGQVTVFHHSSIVQTKNPSLSRSNFLGNLMHGHSDSS